jgi:hypothetical protein
MALAVVLAQQGALAEFHRASRVQVCTDAGIVKLDFVPSFPQ